MRCHEKDYGPLVPPREQGTGERSWFFFSWWDSGGTPRNVHSEVFQAAWRRHEMEPDPQLLLDAQVEA